MAKHGLKWPHGAVSKTQWRFLYAKGKTDPKMLKVAHMLTERNERQRGEKVGYKTLPFRKRGPTGRSLR
jgi:hypothetical protein